MDTPTYSSQVVDDLDSGPATDGGSCGLLGQIQDERLQLMGLLVRSHRRLSYLLGQELEDAVRSR